MRPGRCTPGGWENGVCVGVYLVLRQARGGWSLPLPPARFISSQRQLPTAKATPGCTCFPLEAVSSDSPLWPRPPALASPSPCHPEPPSLLPAFLLLPPGKVSRPLAPPRPAPFPGAPSQLPPPLSRAPSIPTFSLFFATISFHSACTRRLPSLILKHSFADSCLSSLLV